jgi:hypothetical protein
MVGFAGRHDQHGDGLGIQLHGSSGNRRGSGKALPHGRCWHGHKEEIASETLKDKGAGASRHELASGAPYYDESKK